ncbi:MAG: hypothetical protein COW18_08205 [Zetaproteobacteria bacterium CG12_big_fil_rev_8_21_14_0_65_54_13]|nr:MAG: hypothetical protein COX55_03380 [Zetaproteobacteria bacterium CG23_combo_of_CG06-09_8_20_14_all_54_7]PIW47933.1 MAG: hypothetical protein COW18_08205 [Zetaproteobacteria bacterium CG12_big_fil_rev_8_21_14_0_65_54_13]PIX53805.1 MAG: hypothetical protein COZ50_11165 [Zetaproteobacteria bacterium CG_4_10_14_3_um_filter_54_28]PJA30853.1 MAG: hypothetical protein CO188_01695 [Zetaproteobacteria bacterium CG_4_9_14_3_um_filter_54_145]
MKVCYQDDQLERIVDQAVIYQCACPAQVVNALRFLRDLHNYQQDCLNESDTDKLVHQCIATDAESAYKLLEDCLGKVLKLEGWDEETLKMPENLVKRMVENVNRQ